MCDRQFTSYQVDELLKTLWSDGTRSRQFLIPDNQELPAGEFLLRTATGRERYVDEAAVSDFEVSAEDAEAWAKAQLAEVTRRLKDGIKSAIQVKFGREEKTGEDDGNKPKRQTSGTPGLDLLADITDTPRESFDGDYRAAGRAFGDYLKDIASTIGDAVSVEPQRQNAARRRMRTWERKLRQHGIQAPGAKDAENKPEDERTHLSEEADRTQANSSNDEARDKH